MKTYFVTKEAAPKVLVELCGGGWDMGQVAKAVESLRTLEEKGRVRVGQTVVEYRV